MTIDEGKKCIDSMMLRIYLENVVLALVFCYN